MDVIYLDHNSTTPVPDEVLEDLAALSGRTFGNPSSPHAIGRQCRLLMREAAQAIAEYLSCTPEEVYFTSGASEGNSWVIHSISHFARLRGHKPRLLLSSIEHESTFLAAERSGCEVVFLRTTSAGQLDLEDLDLKLSTQGTWDLLSLVHANNETGVVQPVREAISKAKAQQLPVHIDCAQALGRVPISVAALGADYLTFSGHKIGAPRGTGFVISAQSGLAPLIHGKQQQGLRGGTENVLGVSLLGRILRQRDKELEPFPEHLAEWHREFETRINQAIEGAVVHGASAPRIRNTTFVGFNGIKSDSILIGLDLAGICASQGSACSSGSTSPSRVLLAMGCGEDLARSSIRFSSGRSTKWQDFERVLELLPALVTKVRKGSLQAGDQL